MNFNNWLYKKFLPPFGWAAINLLTNSLRIKIINKSSIDNCLNNGKQLVYVLWHGRQFLFTTHLGAMHAGVITSTSRDGRLQADILSRMGFTITHGSSSKSPIKALMGSVKLMRKGVNMAIAVDGPTGPLHKVKPGELFLAKKMNALIVPVTFSARPSLILKAWDKYLLPLPFSKAIIMWGDPIQLSSSTDKDILLKESSLIEKRLTFLNNKVDNMVFKKIH